VVCVADVGCHIYLRCDIAREWTEYRHDMTSDQSITQNMTACADKYRPVCPSGNNVKLPAGRLSVGNTGAFVLGAFFQGGRSVLERLFFPVLGPCTHYLTALHLPLSLQPPLAHRLECLIADASLHNSSGGHLSNEPKLAENQT